MTLLQCEQLKKKSVTLICLRARPNAVLRALHCMDFLHLRFRKKEMGWHKKEVGDAMFDEKRDGGLK